MMVIITIFLVGLQGLTPGSVQATITAPVTEIAPQVSGRVIAIAAFLGWRVLRAVTRSGGLLE